MDYLPFLSLYISVLRLPQSFPVTTPTNWLIFPFAMLLFITITIINTCLPSVDVPGLSFSPEMKSASTLQSPGSFSVELHLQIKM